MPQGLCDATGPSCYPVVTISWMIATTTLRRCPSRAAEACGATSSSRETTAMIRCPSLPSSHYCLDDRNNRFSQKRCRAKSCLASPSSHSWVVLVLSERARLPEAMPCFELFVSPSNHYYLGTRSSGARLPEAMLCEELFVAPSSHC